MTMSLAFRDTKHPAAMAQHRAEMYRQFIPEWPLLVEVFEREAARIRAALAAKKEGSK